MDKDRGNPDRVRHKEGFRASTVQVTANSITRVQGDRTLLGIWLTS